MVCGDPGGDLVHVQLLQGLHQCPPARSERCMLQPPPYHFFQALLHILMLMLLNFTQRCIWDMQLCTKLTPSGSQGLQVETNFTLVNWKNHI